MKHKGRIVVVLMVMVMIFVVVSALKLRTQLRCEGFPGPGVTAEELPPPASSDTVRVAQWNIRNFPLDQRPQDSDLGYSRRTNICDLHDALHGLDADVIGFEEITDTQRFSPILKRAGGRRSYRLVFGSHGGRHHQMIALAWDDDRIEMVGEFEEIAGVAVNQGYKPALVATFRTRQDPPLEFTVVQLHLASAPRGFSHRRQQYQALVDWIDENALGAERANLIVQGDFNVTGWEGGSQAEELALLDDLMRGAGLRRSPNSSGCTEYWEGGGRWDGIQVPSLLDLVYLKGFNDRQVTSPESWLHCKRYNCGELVSKAGHEDGTFWDVSDHCPVTFEISPGP